MMIRFAMALAVALLACGAAQAQAPSLSPGLPLGVTSPLGIGPAGPVGPTRIPLGATELATPGASTILSGASPLDPLSGVACGGALSAAAISAAVTSATTGASSSAAFDGGGMGASTAGAGIAGGGMASASGPCAPTGGGGAATAPATSTPGSPVAPVGVPMGATEMGSAGLSPPSVALIPNPSAPIMSTLSPLAPPSSNSSASSSLSTSSNPPPCTLTQTGVPTISGVPTTFGSPLAGRALGTEATRCR